MGKISIDDSTFERISIMIDIMMVILKCSYSDAYSLIINSNTFQYLQQKDYGTLHDSPQANLASIGEELRIKKIEVGEHITDTNIARAMLIMRENYLKNKR